MTAALAVAAFAPTAALAEHGDHDGWEHHRHHGEDHDGWGRHRHREFDNPSTEMRNDVVLDYGLRDKGLTKIGVNPATLQSVRAELDQMKAQGKSLENGYPRTCYDMTLTDDGYNAVLVKSLSVTFDKGRKTQT